MTPSNIKHIIISSGTALLLVVGLLLTLSLHPTHPALADGSIIYVNAGASGNDDGGSWADAYIRLQDALDQANADGATDYEIWVAAGIYTPTNVTGVTATFTLTNNAQLYGGFAATETLRTQRDWETNLTILSGDIDGNDITDANGVVTTTANILGSNVYHVLYLNGEGSEVISSATVIDGFTITAGQAHGSYPNYHGGGLYCAGSGHECSPTLINITFSGNSADEYGGGMYNNGSNHGESSPTLTNITFSGNSAGLQGGGMFNWGAAGVSSPTLTNVTFNGNSAGDSGGGMVNSGSNGKSSPTLTNVTFSGNSADNGGGMFNGGEFGVSSPTLINVTFNSNSADTWGGGMYNWGGDSAESSPTLTNVTFSGNSADSGGGMANSGFESGVSNPILTNVTFNGNSAGGSGGGIANWGFASGVSSPTLTNVTFSGNSADNGGGMVNFGYAGGESSPTLANVILWGNTAVLSGTQVYNYDATPAFSYTLVQSDTNAIINAGTSHITYTGNIITDDPRFTDADGADDTPGTADDDLSLQPASPAVDAGDNSALPADTDDLDGDGDTAETLPVDRASNPRRVDTSVPDTGNGTPPLVDIGAYEAQVYSLTLTVIGAGSVVADPEAYNNVYYNPGQVVTLTATANNGYEFDGWSGDLSGNTTPITLTMNADKVVTATFTTNHLYLPVVMK